MKLATTRTLGIWDAPNLSAKLHSAVNSTIQASQNFSIFLRVNKNTYCAEELHLLPLLLN